MKLVKSLMLTVVGISILFTNVQTASAAEPSCSEIINVKKIR